MTAPQRDDRWLVLLERVSGILLLPLAAMVFVYTYLLNDVADITAFDVERRWSNPVLQLTDWAFVLLALLHGLIGWHWFLGRHVAHAGTRLAVEGVSISVIALAFCYGSLALLAH